jgi:hypothetical protein
MDLMPRRYHPCRKGAGFTRACLRRTWIKVYFKVEFTTKRWSLSFSVLILAMSKWLIGGL